ncbi:MAG: hypothetical protein R3A51_18590 [Nannocystaceae bacterium]|nr:hypothetical protein [Myxococcales bacterium]
MPIVSRLSTPVLAALLGSACNYSVHMDTDAGTDATTGTTAGSETTAETDTGNDSDTEDTDSDTGIDEPEPEAVWPHLDDCDSLVPTQCAFPFPSNVYTVADPDTPTGRRVALPQAAIPVSAGGHEAPPDVWNQADGFSTGVPFMAHLPGATILGLPGPLSIERSLEDDSPTVIIDAESGERVPHFAELDMSLGGDATRTLMVRPVHSLKAGRRYIVAIRGVVDADNNPVDTTPSFRALRDLSPSDDPTIEARRPLYADIFQRLAAAGVDRAELQLAWDFTTASTEDTTKRLLHMRDDALAQVGADGPEYIIQKVTAVEEEDIALKVEGRMIVPLYLDKPESGGTFVLDSDGLPTQNGTAEYEFLMLIPYAAYKGPASPLAYGHGLLGEKDQVGSGTFKKFANDYGFVLFAVDWIGMAADDYINVAGILSSGELERFNAVVDRGQQGILNFILATRMMLGPISDDPMLAYQGDQPEFTKDEAYYFGNSQGGIFGATLMAVHVDVTRGMLGVPGQPYNLLLNRSVDFEPFFDIVRSTYQNDPMDIQMVLALIQMLWDRSEPNGYSAHIRENTLPNTPAHEVMLQVAIGDYQVSTLGAHHMARTIGGVPNITPANRSIWGIDEVAGGYAGSAMIEYDFGNPPEPTVNIPPEDLDDDPHGKPRKLETAQQSLNKFLREGVVDSFCDGACDPE